MDTSMFCGNYPSLEMHQVGRVEDTISRYPVVTMITGPEIDRHAEGMAVATFAGSLREATMAFTETSLSLPLLHTWNRVVSALPNFF